MAIMSKITNFFLTIYILSWDVLLTTLNLILPNKKVGHIVPQGHIGEGGKWGEYIAPKEGDSRCACPAMNAMANHGILPRDGKNITFKQMSQTIHSTFNFAPTFCLYVPNFMAGLLGKSYWKDTLDLADMNLHNGIEHDASLTRQDTYHVSDQGPPDLKLVQGLLDSATGKASDGSPLLTIADVARYSGKRRTDARKDNEQFTLSFNHKMFGSSNASTLLTIFGGKIDDITSLLIEERLPEGWEPRIKSRYGLTMATFNGTVFRVEAGTKAGKPDEFYKKPETNV